MTMDALDAPAGWVVGWRNAFTSKELDAIEAYGDSLEPMKAEIDGRKADNTDHLRITRIAWMDRVPQVEWLYAKIEQAVLEMNSRLYKYDLYGLVENFQYTVYHASEGGHYDWHCDTGKMAQPRKISLTLQLSEPSAYEGGPVAGGGRGADPRPQSARHSGGFSILCVASGHPGHVRHPQVAGGLGRRPGFSLSFCPASHGQA